MSDIWKEIPTDILETLALSTETHAQHCHDTVHEPWANQPAWLSEERKARELHRSIRIALGQRVYSLDQC